MKPHVIAVALIALTAGALLGRHSVQPNSVQSELTIARYNVPEFKCPSDDQFVTGFRNGVPLCKKLVIAGEIHSGIITNYWSNDDYYNVNIRYEPELNPNDPSNSKNK